MNIPQHYIPNTLSPQDRKKQKQQIEKSMKDYKKNNRKYVVREKLESFAAKPSNHIVDLKRAYPHIKSMSNLEKISKEFNIPLYGVRKIIEKGQGAYFSSGSRPNQTPDSWAYARLASAVLGRNACNVDSHIITQNGVTCESLRKKYAENSKKNPKVTKCLPSEKPFPIIRENVMLSYFKTHKNPIKAVKDSIKSFKKGETNKIYGKHYGLSSLKAMGLVPRSNGKYDINSTTKPYCQNYIKYYM